MFQPRRDAGLFRCMGRDVERQSENDDAGNDPPQSESTAAVFYLTTTKPLSSPAPTDVLDYDSGADKLLPADLDLCVPSKWRPSMHQHRVAARSWPTNAAGHTENTLERIPEPFGKSVCVWLHAAILLRSWQRLSFPHGVSSKAWE